jgi:DNA-binding Xre family transcriptional regulator
MLFEVSLSAMLSDRDLKTTRLFERISVHKVSAMLAEGATN